MLNLLFGVRGRIGRGSWWLAQFIAIPVIVLMGMGGLAGIVGLDEGAPPSNAAGAMGFLVIAVAVVASIWINIASTVKRFHDRGKSGFWFLVVFIPLIGGIWQLVECGFCTGDDGDNDYGPPRDRPQRAKPLIEKLREWPPAPASLPSSMTTTSGTMPPPGEPDERAHGAIHLRPACNHRHTRLPRPAFGKR